MLMVKAVLCRNAGVQKTDNAFLLLFVIADVYFPASIQVGF